MVMGSDGGRGVSPHFFRQHRLEKNAGLTPTPAVTDRIPNFVIGSIGSSIAGTADYSVNDILLSRSSHAQKPSRGGNVNCCAGGTRGAAEIGPCARGKSEPGLDLIGRFAAVPCDSDVRAVSTNGSNRQRNKIGIRKGTGKHLCIVSARRPFRVRGAYRPDCRLIRRNV